VLAFLSCACARPPAAHTLNIAAAANLNAVFDEIGRAFTARTGVKIVNSFASTAQLSHQIENGAPFDVFAAADTEHVDQLVRDGKLLAASRAVYARGKLVLWVPKVPSLRTLQDLTRPEIRFIAIATPAAAPYGKAAVQTLQATRLWDKLERKIAYATNINLAREYAASGNAEAAFTAYSLVMNSGGRIIEIDPASHEPLDQAIAVLSSSKQAELAREFLSFVTKGAGSDILRRYGYGVRAH
jgi:molybdate transport system substrate-binding protein